MQKKEMGARVEDSYFINADNSVEKLTKVPYDFVIPVKKSIIRIEFMSIQPEHTIRILGIESSCDETAAAVVENGTKILSNVVATQIDLHAHYGGVFPELASREHIKAIYPVVEQALKKAHLDLSGIDAIAVTRGPGLPGSLVVWHQHGKRSRTCLRHSPRGGQPTWKGISIPLG